MTLVKSSFGGLPMAAFNGASGRWAKRGEKQKAKERENGIEEKAIEYSLITPFKDKGSTSIS
jgi:hypothetical protein